jgi:hypothetical protein
MRRFHWVLQATGARLLSLAADRGLDLRLGGLYGVQLAETAAALLEAGLDTLDKLGGWRLSQIEVELAQGLFVVLLRLCVPPGLVLADSYVEHLVPFSQVYLYTTHCREWAVAIKKWRCSASCVKRPNQPSHFFMKSYRIAVETIQDYSEKFQDATHWAALKKFPM